MPRRYCLVGNIPPSNRNSRRLKPPWLPPCQTPGPETWPDALPPCGLRWLPFSTMEEASQHAQQSAQLAQQILVDTFAAYGVFVARLKLVQGDVSGAAAALEEAEAFVRRYNFVFRMPDVAAAQVLLLLHQGHLAAAAHLAHLHDLLISQARVHLAQGNPSAALAVLLPWRRQVEAKG